MSLSKASCRLNTERATQATLADISLTGFADSGYLADSDFNVWATLIQG
jgi:hypothetical protein